MTNNLNAALFSSVHTLGLVYAGLLVQAGPTQQQFEVQIHGLSLEQSSVALIQTKANLAIDFTLL